MVSSIEAALISRELKIASSLTEARDLVAELESFGRQISAAGNFQYNARGSKNDDLVTALGLCVWHFKRPSKAVTIIPFGDARSPL